MRSALVSCRKENPMTRILKLDFALFDTMRLCRGSLSPLERKRSAFCFSSLQSDSRISMVQGASRGIGLEFVKQLLERDEKEHVIATCRNPNSSTGLCDLKHKFNTRLDILPLDLTAESTIEDSANAVKSKYGHLNLLINASGILSIPNVIYPETSLQKLEKSSLMLAYEVNAVGPILVIKHMWPLMKARGRLEDSKDCAVIASLSARVGSIGDNNLGGWHSYRSSKTALNQLSKTASVEFGRKKNKVICLLLHPGTVDTDLSKPFQKNVAKGKLFSKEYSVKKLLHIIDNAQVSDNGKFFAWDGQLIPW